jgi:tetratricopeptide (TPR) repeat protein
MAVSLLRQAIVLKPENADYYNAFALLCLDHDSFQVGIDMIDAGLQRIPEASSLYLSRGLLFAQLAQYDKAEADFKNAEHFDSTQTLSSYALDLAELQKNQSGKTITEIRSQLKAHPDSPLLQYLLAKLLATQESETDIKVSAEAMHAALLAVKLKPDLVEARDLLASMYMTSGQYDLAINQCRLALQYTPSDRSAMYHLIIALRHSKQSGQSNEIDGLVKRLSDLQQASLQQETARKRFRLVEQESEPAK